MRSTVAAPRQLRHRRSRDVRWMLLAIVVACVSPGCITARNMMVIRTKDPMAGAQRLQNKNIPSMEQVVAHLNRNTDAIESWKTNEIRIHAKGIAIPLSGRLAVERGRHVRLVVSSPRGTEVDLGSNDQGFWIWSRENRPAIVTCRHENMEMVRQTEGIPFEPDWLMQALSVAPIPNSGVEFETAPTNDEARLVLPIVTAHSQPLRRVIVVDLKKGGVITEHALYDYNSRLIASAKLSHHWFDKKTRVVLPHRVVLDWPHNKMGVTMELGKIEINPQSLPSEVWVMPRFPKSEIVNLDENVRHQRVVTRSGRTVHLNTIDDASGGEEMSVDESDEDEPPENSDETTSSDAEMAGHSSVVADDDEFPVDDKRAGKIQFTAEDEN